MSEFKVGDRVLARQHSDEEYKLGTLVEINSFQHPESYAVIFDCGEAYMHNMPAKPYLKCPEYRGWFCRLENLKHITEEETNSLADEIKDLWVAHSTLIYEKKFLRTENADLKDRLARLEYEYDELKNKLREAIK